MGTASLDRVPAEPNTKAKRPHVVPQPLAVGWPGPTRPPASHPQQQQQVWTQTGLPPLLLLMTLLLLAAPLLMPGIRLRAPGSSDRPKPPPPPVQVRGVHPLSAARFVHRRTQ